MDRIKEYLISVGLKKYAPTAIMAAMTAMGTLFMAHQGMFETWGINYLPDWSQLATWLTTHPISGPVFIIELDTTSSAAIAAIVGLVALWSRGVEYHTAAKPPKEGA